MRTVVHAPDGGIAVGALCQEPTGDTTTIHSDVSCPDCLDALDELPPGRFTQVSRHTIELRQTKTPT